MEANNNDVVIPSEQLEQDPADLQSANPSEIKEMGFDEAFDFFLKGGSLDSMQMPQGAPEENDRDTLDGQSDNDDETSREMNAADDDDNGDEPEGGNAGDPASDTRDTGIFKDGVMDYQKLYEEKKSQFSSLEGRMRVQTEEARAQKERIRELERLLEDRSSSSTKPGASKSDNFLVSDDDLKDSMPDSLAEFMELYPEVAKPVKDLINLHVNKAMAAVDEKLQPLAATIVQSQASSHISAIKAQHPDLDAILDSGDLFAWRETLPAVKKIAVDYIITNGTTGEIIDMLNDYKQARGAKPRNASPAQANATKQPKPVSQETVNKIKDAMAVPTGRAEEPRQMNNSAPDVNDFDAWWDRFSAK